MARGKTFPRFLCASIDPEDAAECLSLRASDGLDGCLEWFCGDDYEMYGTCRFLDPQSGLRRPEAVHRIAWVLANKMDIPANIHVCHRCDNPSCIQPRHLFLGTAKMNIHDSMAKGRRPSGKKGPRVRKIAALSAARGTCQRGHPWTPDNLTTYLVRGKFPAQRCSTCWTMGRNRVPALA